MFSTVLRNRAISRSSIIQSIPFRSLPSSPQSSFLQTATSRQIAGTFQAQRSLTSSIPWRENATTNDQPQLPPPSADGSSKGTQQIGKIDPRLSLTFTCTAPIAPDSHPHLYDASGNLQTTSTSAAEPIPEGVATTSQTSQSSAILCGHRSTHEFSKRSYEKGLVLIQCPHCKSRHLIADHLGWFKESTEDGTLKTVEDLLRAKGEKVMRGRVNFDGDVEYDGQ